MRFAILHARSIKGDGTKKLAECWYRQNQHEIKTMKTWKRRQNGYNSTTPRLVFGCVRLPSGYTRQPLIAAGMYFGARHDRLNAPVGRRACDTPPHAACEFFVFPHESPWPLISILGAIGCAKNTVKHRPSRRTPQACRQMPAATVIRV